MTLLFENEYEKPFPLEGGREAEELAAQVAEAVLDYVGCPFEAQVNFLLTGDDEIHEMNRLHRGIDRATDVLSFPLIDFPVPGDFSFLEGEGEEGAECFDPDSGELCLGDIVVSADHAAAQAEEYGHQKVRELAFLTAHSMLHLMGYDHMEEEEAAKMERMQEEILESLGIVR